MFSVVSLDQYHPPVGSQSFDLVGNGSLYPDFGIPVWVSLAFWVDTADALAAGDGFTIDINYVDPTGQTRSISGTPFGLGDATGFSVIPVTPIQRLSATSLVEAVLTRNGSGLGDPVVSARIMCSRLCLDNLASNLIWTP